MAKYTGDEIKRKILRRLGGEKKGLSADALAQALRLKKKERPLLLLTLERMEQRGEVVCGKKGRYTLAGASDVRARLLSLNRGFGFARPEDGGADCFIPGRFLNGALPGDTVLVRLGPPDARGPQGEITQVLEQGGRLYTGRLVSAGEKRQEVLPDSLIRFPLPVEVAEHPAAGPLMFHPRYGIPPDTAVGIADQGFFDGRGRSPPFCLNTLCTYKNTYLFLKSY